MILLIAAYSITCNSRGNDLTDDEFTWYVDGPSGPRTIKVNKKDIIIPKFITGEEAVAIKIIIKGKDFDSEIDTGIVLSEKKGGTYSDEIMHQFRVELKFIPLIPEAVLPKKYEFKCPFLDRPARPGTFNIFPEEQPSEEIKLWDEF